MTLRAPHKSFAMLAFAAGLSACSTTVDSAAGSPVMRTDAGASMSQMWSHIFSGKLRSAPQPQYSFNAGLQNSASQNSASQHSGQAYSGPQYVYGGEDATLNTQRLQNRLAVNTQGYGQNYGQYRAAQPGAVPQLRRHAETRIQPNYGQAYSAPTPRPAPQPAPQPYIAPPYSAPSHNVPAQAAAITPPAAAPKKKSLGYRIGSLFRGSQSNTSASSDTSSPLAGYETQTRTYQAPAQIPAQAPAQQTAARPAPPPRAQPVYNTQGEYGAAPAQPSVPSPVPAPVTQTASAPAPVTRPTIAPTPAPAPQSSSVYTPNAQAKTEGSSARRVADIDSSSLSYVKMGGGSNIADWESCEATAGGYFIPSSTGFSVLPAFDRCMRERGYKSEAEAIAALERSPR